MKNILRLIIAATTLSLAACHEIKEQPADAKGVFDALWLEIDRHYCFLDEKGLDWNEVYSRYSPRISNNMGRDALFQVCSEMLAELRDGHVNLSTPFATSYYTKWWSDYPQNYNERLIQQYYFNFNYRSLGAITYGFLPQNIAYIHYSTFSSGIGEGNLDYILAYFAPADALIIDVRDNGGGNISNVEQFVNRFITKRTLAGYMLHKTGPGHNEFSEPYAYYIDPVANGHYTWSKPVVVICNRSTFSAANNFVSIMKLLPGVTIVGSTTGGGSGMPYSSELPNGWGIRMSACPVLDANGHATEQGVEPTPGCHVDMDPADELNGHDTILDFAVNYIFKNLF